MILISLAENEIEPVEYKLYDVAFDFLMEYGGDLSVIVNYIAGKEEAESQIVKISIATP